MINPFRNIVRSSSRARGCTFTYSESKQRRTIATNNFSKAQTTMTTAAEVPARAAAVLEYWFGAGYAAADNSFVPREKMGLWFRGGPEIDQYITDHFAADVRKVGEGEYDGWRDAGPLSLLAGVILMDQFTRNIYRGKPEAFSLDAKALSWSEHAVAAGADQALAPMLRYFVYMPYMHAENLTVQQRGVELFHAAADATAAAGPPGAEAANCLRMAAGFAERHRDVVAAWGRFPHRNAILGRPSTPEELAGLADGSIAKF